MIYFSKFNKILEIKKATKTVAFKIVFNFSLYERQFHHLRRNIFISDSDEDF